MNIPTEHNLLRVAFTSNATAQLSPTNSATGNATTAQPNSIELASLLDLGRNRLRNKLATYARKGAQLGTRKEGLLLRTLSGKRGNYRMIIAHHRCPRADVSVGNA